MGDNDILVMRKLVSALESAPEGSAILDLQLGRDLRSQQIAVNDVAVHGLMAELSAETIENIVGETVVPFTRSLDAVLPGENIVFSMYSGDKKLWVSVQRDSSGQEFVSWAASEPLSRRAAALRSIARISTTRSDSDVVSLSGADDGTAEGAEQVSGAPQPGWRVSF